MQYVCFCTVNSYKIGYNYCRQLYWSSSNSSFYTIEKASMDGTNRSCLHLVESERNVAIAIDHLNEVLYWTLDIGDYLYSYDRQLLIESSNLDGSNRRTVAILYTYVRFHLPSIPFYDGSLHFLSNVYRFGDQPEVYSVNLSNTSQVTTYSYSHTAYFQFCDIRVTNGLVGITVISNEQQPQSTGISTVNVVPNVHH